MDGATLMLIAGILIGAAMFLGAAYRALGYATRGAGGPLPSTGQSLRGLVCIALAACGALYVFTSLTFMARLKETEAELIHRRKIVASLDRKIYVYRDGIRRLQGTVADARGDAASEALARRIEALLGEIRQRERKLP